MPSLSQLLRDEEEESSEEVEEDDKSQDEDVNPAAKMDEEDPWADPIPETEGSVSPLGEELVTLSTGAKSKWKSLVNLDVIRVRKIASVH